MVSLYLDSGDWRIFPAYSTRVDGFTTNPSLAKDAGVENYRDFAVQAVLSSLGKPISLEVLADDLLTMESQARFLSGLGTNVYVKIPVSTTNGDSTGHLIHALSREGIKLNVTAILTFDQIKNFARQLYQDTPSILSIFAGRIADTGINPIYHFTAAAAAKHHNTKLLWASAREVLNVKQAEQCGADIITLSPVLLEKTKLFGKDLNQYSLETVQQFVEDGKGIAF